MRCAYCPAGPGDRCPGGHLCDKVDPGHPRYDARFVPAVREAARKLGAIAGAPGLDDRAASLGRALWSWVVSGFRIADEGERARRRAICAACPEWIASRRRCRICGCFTDVKVALRTEHCPLDPPKW